MDLELIPVPRIDSLVHSYCASMRRYLSSVASQSRPSILELLPPKRFVNRILFDLDSRLNYKKVIPVLDTIYQSIPSGEDPIIPKYATPDDLMLFQKALKEIRQKTRTENRYLMQLENALVEKAAESGQRDAVSVLAFTAIKDQNNQFTDDDKAHARKLIKELMKLKHPLAIKLTGDMLYQSNALVEAEKMYMRFLELEKDTILSAEVHKSLGVIFFKDLRHFKARTHFEKSIRLAPLDKVYESHFYLSQLYSNDDPLRSRHHLQLSSSQGLRESLANLGFLELNYFNNADIAFQWFKLGAEITDITSLIGLFDCYMLKKEYHEAVNILDQLRDTLTSDSYKNAIKTGTEKVTWEQLQSVRAKSLETLSSLRLL